MSLQSYLIELGRLKRAFHHAYTNNLPIIYTDETVFTSLTFQNTTYSAKFTPHLVDQEDLQTQRVEAIAFFSAELGLVHMDTYTQKLNGEMYAGFIDDCSKKMGRKPFALLMDGHFVHKALIVKELLSEREITLIMNIPYSPQFNGAEGCFSIVKNHYKRQRLRAMINREHYSVQKLIRESFDQLNRGKIKAMIGWSTKKLFGDQGIDGFDPDNKLGFA